jgi:AcrR family transcriptional regulator
MVKPTTQSATRGDATRESLLAAAIDAFSRDGFDAASTRAIAEAAGVPQALIGYHFRGKEGLYLAVFEHLAGELEQRVGPVRDAVEAALAADAPGRARERHLELLLRMVDTMTLVLSREESAPWARLILREQQDPTRAFEILYSRVFGRVADLITRLVASVRGGGTEQEARLTFMTIMGQVVVLRAGRASVLRQLGWSKIGDDEVAILREHMRKTVTALLRPAAAPRGRKRPPRQRGKQR